MTTQEATATAGATAYGQADPLPEWLRGASPLFGQAAAAGWRLTLVTAPLESTKITAKRRHDVKAALRTLGFAVQALESGYTFQDDLAKAKTEAIAKAVQLLEREGEVLLKLLAAGSNSLKEFGP